MYFSEYVFIVSLCFDIVNLMLILVIVFVWFIVSLVFRCVICWFDFYFIIELNFLILFLE